MSSGTKPARSFGRFEILEKLGSGAFGVVYRALDTALRREVALKVPLSSALRTPEARARFLREPKAAAQLRHPHIVPVFDAGQEGKSYYIAYAFIEGRTLERALATEPCCAPRHLGLSARVLATIDPARWFFPSTCTAAAHLITRFHGAATRMHASWC